jgi:exodeoxyribonuclease VII large subunit
MTISRLQQEGIFNKNQTLSLPLLPRRIAIISVETSKGYSDFMKVLLGNEWGYGFFHMLFPAFLQGEKAVPSIMAQLKRIQKVIHHFDVVAIIRGGGGEVGLTCYNNYELSRAIATYPIPVLTGIGHSTNETVSEMVAFKNAITPTELADFLIQQYHNYSVPLQEFEQAVVAGAWRIIRENRTELFNQARYLNSVTKNMLLGNRNALAFASRTLLQDSRKVFVVGKTNIRMLSRQVSRAAISNLVLHKRRIEELRLLMTGSVSYLVRKRRMDLENVEKLIEVLSPHHVLKRGYSITSANGKLVTSISEVKPGEILITTLADGSISSTVQSKTINQ